MSRTTHERSEAAITAVAKTTNTGTAPTIAPGRRGLLSNRTPAVVRDHDGRQLACVYFEDEPGRRSAAKLLTKDEARRIAAKYRQICGSWFSK